MKTEYPFNVSFWIAKEPTHTVEVRAWCSKGTDGSESWNWNVYGHVFEAHAWFDKPEILKTNMPLHYGASLEQLKIIRPALGIQYDWQKEHKTYTFGSDYSHYTDTENHPSPFEGVPYYVKRDALELAEWLQERAVKEHLC